MITFDCTALSGKLCKHLLSHLVTHLAKDLQALLMAAGCGRRIS